jgi:hypothetical protein
MRNPLGAGIGDPGVPSSTYLMNHQHWQLPGIPNVPGFLRSLSFLVPSDAWVALASGLFWDQLAPMVAVPSDCARPSNEALALLSPEFGDADILPVTPSLLASLEQLAASNSTSALFVHFAVFTEQGPVLEWFDAPGDPVSIAPLIHEDIVAAVALAAGAQYRNAPGD